MPHSHLIPRKLTENELMAKFGYNSTETTTEKSKGNLQFDKSMCCGMLVWFNEKEKCYHCPNCSRKVIGKLA